MSAAQSAAPLQPLKNAKHERVLQAWIADPARIWWKAWQSVYPKSSQHAAETSSSRLLRNAEFSARRDVLMGQVAEQVVAAAVMSQVEVLEELSKLGRSSIKNCIVQGDNTADVVEQLRDMTDEHAASIKSLTVETYIEGGGEDAREVKKLRIELHDKKGALSELRRHYEPQKHEHSGPKGGPIEHEHSVDELGELEWARRIAFALERGARATAGKKGKHS